MSPLLMYHHSYVDNGGDLFWLICSWTASGGVLLLDDAGELVCEEGDPECFCDTTGGERPHHQCRGYPLSSPGPTRTLETFP